MDDLARTIAMVESELVALQAYAARHGWKVTWQPEQLVVLLDGVHPADSSVARLRAGVDKYKMWPPAWRFLRTEAGREDEVRAPKAGTLPGGVSSMFIDKGVICAPFNRLAYTGHGGPHGDWNGVEKWLEVKGTVSATNLAEMFAQILAHLNHSPGWQ